MRAKTAQQFTTTFTVSGFGEVRYANIETVANQVQDYLRAYGEIVRTEESEDRNTRTYMVCYRDSDFAEDLWSVRGAIQDTTNEIASTGLDVEFTKPITN